MNGLSIHAARSTQHILRWHLLLLLLTLLAFLLRLYQLDQQSLRGDEAATVLYSAMPVSELWELARVTDPHPPLYYAMLHPWQGLVGEGVWAMRFAGAAASTLAIPALYGLSQFTLSRRPLSLLAAALLTLNPLQIWLAQDIRSYPFFTTLGLLSSMALWTALNGVRCQVSGVMPQSRRPSGPTRLWRSGVSRLTSHAPRTTHHLFTWTLYIILTIACFYIHYYTVFLIAFQSLFALLQFRRYWSHKWPWLTVQVSIGLALIPGLLLAYRFAGGEATGGIETLPLPEILRLASTSLLTGFTISDNWGLWISLLLTPIWLLGLIVLLRRDGVAGIFWALFFAAPVLGVIGLSIDRPFFKERFLVQAQPAFALLLAAGFLTLAQRGLKIRNKKLEIRNKKLPTHKGPSALINHQLPITNLQLASYFLILISLFLLIFLVFVNALALSNYFANPAYAKAPPWRLYHDYVSDQARPGDVMLTNFPEAAVSYYSPNNLPFYVVPAERDRSATFREEQTAQIAGAYQRIWFLPLLRQGFDEQGDVLNWLDRHADRVNQVFFPDYNVNLYLSPSSSEAAMIPQPAAFAHGLHLRGYQIFDKKGESRLAANPGADGYLISLKPEEKFTLSLYWQADAPTAVPYTVFVHLIAADGFNRTSQDNQPVWGSYPTTQWQPGEKITDKYTLTIPAGTPPGDHRLQLGWYDAVTQQRVPVLDESGQLTIDYFSPNLIIRVEP